MGEFNVNKSDGSLEQTAGMPSEYPATQVMMSDGVTSVEDALLSKVQCVKAYINDVEYPSGRSGDFYAYLPSQYATKTIVSAFAFSESKAIKPYITYFDNVTKCARYYTENSESSAMTRNVVVTFIII